MEIVPHGGMVSMTAFPIPCCLISILIRAGRVFAKSSLSYFAEANSGKGVLSLAKQIDFTQDIFSYTVLTCLILHAITQVD